MAQQAQSCGLAHRLASAGDAELGVDVPGVCPHRVHRHAELTSNAWPTQVTVEQAKDVQLTVAERVDQGTCRCPSGALAGLTAPRRPLFTGGEHSLRVLTPGRAWFDTAEQRDQARPCIEEHPDVALSLAQGQSATQLVHGTRTVVFRQ